MDFAGIQGLSRCAANWVRLVLLVFAAHIPWWGSKDSWRFAHVAFRSFQFSRSSYRLRGPLLGFDQTLGYPGEGPRCFSLRGPWFDGFRQCLFLLRECFSGLHGFWTLMDFGLELPYLLGGFLVCLGLGLIRLSLLFRFWTSAFWSPLCLSSGLSFSWLLTISPSPRLGTRKGPFGFFRGRWLVIFGMMVLPGVGAVSHGQMLPRDAADKRRAASRVPADLPSGRPVLKQTQAQRDRLLSAFDLWLKAEGLDLSSILDVVTLDPETINLLLRGMGDASTKQDAPMGITQRP